MIDHAAHLPKASPELLAAVHTAIVTPGGMQRLFNAVRRSLGAAEDAMCESEVTAFAKSYAANGEKTIAAIISEFNPPKT